MSNITRDVEEDKNFAVAALLMFMRREQDQYKKNNSSYLNNLDFNHTVSRDKLIDWFNKNNERERLKQQFDAIFTLYNNLSENDKDIFIRTISHGAIGSLP